MKDSKAKTKKRSLSLGKKIVLWILLLAVAALAAYIVYFLIHYKAYNKYREFLSDYEVEEGYAYSPLSKGSSVSGMDLISESRYLRLYADTSTGYIAVEDKRDGSFTYSNPADADDDPIANTTNKNYLKSQFLLYYYDPDCKSGSYDSYSQCVAKNQLEYESIDDGIRFMYTIGEKNAKGSTQNIYFVIPLEYRLYDDYLEVSVPTRMIEEYGNSGVYRIQLLRYMGAASTDETGYMVVPNASGSLIYFNNGKNTASSYSQYVYDIDPLTMSFVTTENTDAARLSMFGICREDRSLLVTFEDGASVGVIYAGVSGNYNSYNYAYPIFVLRNADNLKSFGDSALDVFVMEDDIYDINCRVRYTFLGEDYSGYSGLARYYRERLIGEGVLTKNDSEGDIPMYYDVLADVQETGHFLGVQHLNNLAMTTFEEAGDIAEALKDAGVSNQVMNLQGWFNGGYYQKAPHDIRVIAKLGGKSGLEKLQERMREQGVKMYVDTSFQKITFADRQFDYNNEASRYYGAGYAVAFGQVNPTSYINTVGLGYMETRYNLLSPKYLPRYVEKFSRKIGRYDLDGISLRDLGNTLSSDKRRTNVINREEALDVVIAQLDAIQGTGKSLMTDYANDYAFGYSENVINVPTSGNDYPIVDANIPLYEMILHGYVDYSSELLNYEDSYHLEDKLLELIEAGAAPHYVFTWEESSKMKDTGMSRYYATTFDTWKDVAVTAYNEVNSVLSYVSGAAMTEHEIVTDDVRRITYDNGVSIWVNYSDEAYADDNISIPGKSAVVKEGQ